jgi:hypothetical protein
LPQDEGLNCARGEPSSSFKTQIRSAWREKEKWTTLIIFLKRNLPYKKEKFPARYLLSYVIAQLLQITPSTRFKNQFILGAAAEFSPLMFGEAAINAFSLFTT